jgi:nitroimidazol reductase NimA-like FMN-containing flavoprotein (pyridoxamine 5'-phosphate oxidase superfamily)
LAACNVVRIAFRDGNSSYLIPLGYVWLDGALFGVTDPGRKTALAAEDPRVAFQVDTSMETGLFAWDSVTGQGRFEVVDDEHEKQRALAALQSFIATAPDWWWREQSARMAAGELLVWRLRPESMSGVRYASSATAG